MSQAALDVATGLYGKLAADTGAGGVATLATGGIFQMEAVQDTATPYVIISQHTGQTDYTLRVLANDDMLWLVKVVSGGGSSAYGIDVARTIMARVDVILTNQTITVSAGKRLLSLRRETDIPPYKEDDWDTGQVFFHIGALYRIQVTNA